MYWINPLALENCRLFSFALDPDLYISQAVESNDLLSLFGLPMSEQAFGEFQQLEVLISDIRN
jgi:hypothetical protein